MTLTTYGSDNEVDAIFVGEYIAENKKFNFYLMNSQSENTVTGILKSDIRMGVRNAGANLWIVDTYALLIPRFSHTASVRNKAG